jgi:hypothetical protein
MTFLARRSRVGESVGTEGARPSAPARKIAVWRARPRPTFRLFLPQLSLR